MSVLGRPCSPFILTCSCSVLKERDADFLTRDLKVWTPSTLLRLLCPCYGLMRKVGSPPGITFLTQCSRHYWDMKGTRKATRYVFIVFLPILHTLSVHQEYECVMGEAQWQKTEELVTLQIDHHLIITKSPILLGPGLLIYKMRQSCHVFLKVGLD